MAIDFEHESPVYIRDVPDLPIVPRRRNGRTITVATAYGWISKGVKGIRLESASIGGTVVTSEPALQRFFAAVQERRSADAGNPAA